MSTAENSCARLTEPINTVVATSPFTTISVADWIKNNPSLQSDPIPELEEIKKLKQVADEVFHALSILSTRDEAFKIKKGSLACYWDKLHKCDKEILKFWETSLEKSWEKRNVQRKTEQSSWKACFCCCKDDFESAEDKVKKCFNSFLHKLFLSKNCSYTKKIDDETIERIEFLFWQAFHTNFLIKRSLEGNPDPEKPCCFLIGEQRKMLKPDFCEEKLRHKVLVYCNYLIGNLKKEMESIKLKFSG